MCIMYTLEGHWPKSNTKCLRKREENLIIQDSKVQGRCADIHIFIHIYGIFAHEILMVCHFRRLRSSVNPLLVNPLVLSLLETVFYLHTYEVLYPLPHKLIDTRKRPPDKMVIPFDT